jgi:3-oxoadipate enol-lactonase
MLTSTIQIAEPASKWANGCKIINGTRLYYEIKGEGQPLVFLHGYTLDHRMWDNQFHYFARQYQCIRFDTRGFGQSALPGNQPYSYQDDLKALLQSLDITDPVILIGHSIGGQAAVNFAIRYPHYTKALVLVAAQIEGYTFKEFKTEQIIAQARNKSIEYARRKWITHEIFATARKNKITAECLDQMIHFYSGWHFVSENPLVPFNPSPWDQLENILSPALVLYGELDLPDFIEMGEAAAARIPKAKKIIIPHAGHMSNMENPALFNKELYQFLDSVTAD